MSRRFGFALLVALALQAGPSPYVSDASAQTVQALRTLDELEARQWRLAAVARVESLLARLRRTDGAGRTTLVESLPTVERRARAVIEAQDDAREFRDRLEALNDAVDLNKAKLTDAGALDRITDTRAADPTPGVLVPEVVFVLGPEVTDSRGALPVTSLGIYSNLLGAAAGPVLGTITSDKVKTYIINQLSVGTAVPLNGNGRLTGQLGIGLGSWVLKGNRVWAVLNFDQVDSHDKRLPGELVAANPDQRTWSTPTLSFTFAFADVETLRRRIRDSRIVPFVNVGVGAPQYYPGGMFEAVSALLSENRKDFVHTAHPRWTLAVSLPLMPFGMKP